jgi:4-diphosphocytidyl-2-C-methyl-D-erythritol kinase
MRNLILPAPAKLHLFLHLLNEDASELQTAIQFLDFCDELHFHRRLDDQINLTINQHRIPLDENNSVIKAVNCLREAMACHFGADITINKNLPLHTGLGGASSNAATTLLALNYAWQLGLSLEELSELGKKVAPDVPIFIHGHASWAQGKLTDLTPIILPEPWYVLIVPSTIVKAAELYQDDRLTHDKQQLDINHFKAGEGHNDFEPIVRFDYPDIAHALDWLDQHAKAKLSGAGSVVYAEFDTPEEASKIAALVSAPLQAKVVRGLNQSPLQAAMSLL